MEIVTKCSFLKYCPLKKDYIRFEDKEMADRLEYVLNSIDKTKLVASSKDGIILRLRWYLSRLTMLEGPHLSVGNMTLEYSGSLVVGCGFMFSGEKLPFKKIKDNKFEFRPIQFLHLCGTCSPYCEKLLYIDTAIKPDVITISIELVMDQPKWFPRVIVSENAWCVHGGEIKKMP